MATSRDPLEIVGLPPYISSWSAVGLPGFIMSVLNRWQRNYGELPAKFVLLACPQVEINAMGGLPVRVSELTDCRVRVQQFTGCHRPYLVILLLGDDAEERREAIQPLLPWSEGYHVALSENSTQLHFVAAVEDRN